MEREQKLEEIRQKVSSGSVLYFNASTFLDLWDDLRFLLIEFEKSQKEKGILVEGLKKLAKPNSQNITDIRAWKSAQSDPELTDLDWYNFIAQSTLELAGVDNEEQYGS